MSTYDAFSMRARAWNMVLKLVVSNAWLKTAILSQSQMYDVQELYEKEDGTVIPAVRPPNGSVIRTENAAAAHRSS